MCKRKVTVVGAGNVGATTAQRIAEKGLADVVMVEIEDRLGVAKGKALDLWEAAPVEKHDCMLTGAADYADTQGSDIVVITAGIPRKPGQNRADIVATNFPVVKACAENAHKYSPDAIFIVVTNPLDEMAYTAFKATGLPKHRVMGMAGILDTARFRSFIAMELKVSVENIFAFVLGGHGDDMVPLTRLSYVAGVPLPDLIPKDRLDAIVQRTRGGGAEVLKLIGTSAWYAPAAAVAEMVEAILLDRKKILPCSAYLEGEYGQSGLYAGVPCKLGASGIEQIVQVTLQADEQAAFNKSAEGIKKMLAGLVF